jgi:hypothetical protein
MVTLAVALLATQIGGGTHDPQSDQPAGSTGPTNQAATRQPTSGDKPPAGADGPAPTVLDADTSPGAVAVGRLVSAHPHEFTGSYVDTSGTVVAVFAPEADEVSWLPRLESAAAGHPLRIARCSASAATLARIQAELTSFAWPSGRPVYGSVIDVARCAVIVSVQSLPVADTEALKRRFGDSVRVDEGYQPSRR